MGGSVKPYARPRHAKNGGDFRRAKAFEAEVGEALRRDLGVISDNTNSAKDFDFRCDDFSLEVKERYTRPGKRWSQRVDEFWPGFDCEQNLFVLDELSLRKAIRPHRTFFLIRLEDGRMFLNSASELSSFERVRLDRQGENGHRKGKLNFDVRHFRPLDSLGDLVPVTLELLAQETPNGVGHHLASECLSHADVGVV